MTTLYLDTEFNGYGGELISMALVKNNICWYAAIQMTQCVDTWVAENVIPKLETKLIPKSAFLFSFHVFIKQFDNPDIVCDWHADAMHFESMLAGSDYSASLDYPHRMVVVRTPPGQPVSKNPHNALADAMALMEWHRGLP